MDQGRQGKTSPRGVTRRTLLKSWGPVAVAGIAPALVSAACSATAPPVSTISPGAPGAGKAAWEQEWEETVAAAKREGRLAIATSVGVGYRKWLDEFERGFPGIEVEHATFTGLNAFVLKYLEERKAGIYNWDLANTSTSVVLPVLRDQGALDPVRPLLINRPDVIDDQHWRGGFAAGWQDRDKQLANTHQASLSGLVGINTDFVTEGEIKTPLDLLNPKWKGRMVFADPASGSTYVPAHWMRKRYGDDAVKRLLIDQQPDIIRNNAQMAESLVRGKYAISGGGAGAAIMQKFWDEGLGKNVKQIAIPDYTYLLQFAVWLLNRAPHPSAARLFVNWVLTREGSDAYAKNTQFDARRTDVPSYAEVHRDPAVHYPAFGPEEDMTDISETQKFLQELLKLRA